MVRAARAVWKGTVVKVILETGALTEEQTALGCKAAAEGGADFVKTSTGFHPKGGATVQTVGWLKKYARRRAGLKVKASGGIRDLATGRQQMIAAGADRLGCSAGVAIVGGVAAAGGGYWRFGCSDQKRRGWLTDRGAWFFTVVGLCREDSLAGRAKD